MATEADTCRTLVVPKLQAAGWEQLPHSIAEQHYFTDGRIVVRGRTTIRNPGKKADYLLRYTRDFPIAVVEAKASDIAAAAGLQQAKNYAEILGLKFAYATNGLKIVEFDYLTGREQELAGFPTPAELWSRLCLASQLSDSVADSLLAPYHLEPTRIPRYYQQLAINRAVQFILQGRRRILITMATGTGKTGVAFQICWKLWGSHWSRTGESRRSRILYLADRMFLVHDPKDKDFAPFGDARHRIEGEVVFSRNIYFSTYQAIARDERRPGVFHEYPRDFFDLVIIDECHRGSARDDSNWREILEWFEPAFQVGMTATPLREDNRDTYLYFGNPIYTYSLKQGIEDGFLAPFRVHRIITKWDATGWRPPKDQCDRHGRVIPDAEYHTADFERVIALRARTRAIANHLTNFLKETDRFAKTIVFCVDQEHALEMRAALTDLNQDMTVQYPDYICRVTADEGEVGRGHMSRFQDIETTSPVILTTSQLLTTGLDAPTCKNIALARVVNSLVEFKQIIGRGTRVREDYGKLYFNIIDYTGTATINFADQDFDGEPEYASQEEIDEYGNSRHKEVFTFVESGSDATEGSGGEQDTGEAEDDDGTEGKPRKFYFDHGHVAIAAYLVYEYDAVGKQLRVVTLTDYTGEKVRSLFADPDTLRRQWLDPQQRKTIVKMLAERGIHFPKLALQTGQPDAEPLDLLCHLAFNAPLHTRRERADRVKRERREFFEKYGPEARAVLDELLDKYSEHGVEQFVLPDVLHIPPISAHGTVNDIIQLFGSADRIRAAVTELQELIYAA